jgi:hypothetical protein
VSSRHRADIETQLKPDGLRLKISLELNAAHISDAVNAFIDFKVSKLAEENEYDDELHMQVGSYLRRNAASTFLWVALVCKELEDLPVWETLQNLKEFPPGLEPVYTRMIGQIKRLRHTTMGYCLAILSTASVVYRPLHLKELISTAGLPEKPFGDLQLLTKLVDLCASFLTIREERIYFVHQSAKDYFTVGTGSSIFPSGQEDEHYKIVHRSLQLMSKKLKRDISNLGMPGVLLDELSGVDQEPMSHIRYACCYWVDHLRQISHFQQYQVILSDNGEVHLFLQQHFLHWLEALSLMRNMSGGVVMTRALESLFPVSDFYTPSSLFSS